MKLIPSALLLAALSTSAPSFAGVYSDELAKCLVDSTTARDRTTLVRWMFGAATAHPDVASIAKVAPAQMEKANAAVADLLVKLLTESCVDKSRKAVKYEGALAIQQSFQVLGQVAGTELFSNPEVQKATASLEKHIDKQKLAALGK
jgi:hypothetical protein